MQKTPKNLLNVIKTPISSSPRSVSKRNRYLLNEIRNILQSDSWEDTLPFSKVPNNLNPHVIQVLIQENQVGFQSNSKKLPLLAITLCNSNLYGCVSLIIDAMIAMGLSPISIWRSFESCYKEIFDSHCNLNPKVFEMILDRCRVKGVLDEVAEILSRNDYFVPSPLFFNTYLRDLLNDKRLELFWKVCKAMSKKAGVFDVYGYTSMIKAHCIVGNLEEEKMLLVKMGEEGCDPNLVTFNVIIKGMCKTGCLDEAIEIKRTMIDKGLVPNVFIYTTLINAFCVMKRLEEAKRALMEMNELGVEPNMVIYNALVDGFMSQGEVEAAIRVKDEMIASCIGANLVVYNTILHGLCKEHMMERASEVMKEMTSKGLKPDSRTFTLLIHGYCKERRIIDAFAVLEEMKKADLEPNAKSYGLLIIGLCHTRNLDKAYLILVEMCRKKLKLDHIVYETLLSAYSSDYAKSKRVFEVMKEQGIIPCKFCYASLTGSLCRVDKIKIHEARSFMNEMIEMGLEPNACIYEAFINGYCKLHELKLANKYFYTMASRGFMPENATYAVLIEENCRSGNVTDAFSVFRCMISKKGFSDTPCKVLLDGLMKNGHLEEASRLLIELKGHDFVLDLLRVNDIILGLCKKGKLEDAYKLVEDGVVTPSISTYNVLINGFFKIGDTERAKGLLEEMKEKGLTPDEVTYGSMIVGFCKSKDLTTACGLLDEMVRSGVPTYSSLYNIVVFYCYKNGDLEKAKDLSQEMTEKGLTLSLDVLTFKDQESERNQMVI